MHRHLGNLFSNHALIAILLAAFIAEPNVGLAAEQAAGESVTQLTSKTSGDAATKTDNTQEKAADAVADKESSDKKPAAPEYRVAEIVIKGSLPEGPNPGSVFGGVEVDLAALIRRLDKAAEDKKIDAVLLRIRSSGIGRGKQNELRSALQRVKDADKPLIAEMESGSISEYLLASICDLVVIPESGTLMLPGVRAEVMFYKGLFDEVGIEPDMLQVGDFKGAAEPYTRESMSDEFRQQLSTVLDDFYEQMVETVAADRDIEKGRVKRLIDRGMLTATEAKTEGLIDLVAYEQEWRKEILPNKGDKLEIVKEYAKKEVDTDFSGMGGFIKMLDILSGGSGKRKSKKQKVAVVYAVGAITSGKNATGFMGATIGSDTIVKALREARDDDKVVAIVLRVNSPGGSALASDLIWNEIRSIDKPVIASMGDTAASGGYYISMGCDEIYAEPSTLTGSIGVVGGKLVLGKAMERVGLNTEVISRGKNSGMFSVNQAFSPSERKAWMRMMEDIYRQFTEKAAEGRGMKVEDLEKLAGGRVWSGRQAKANGLIDELGTLKDAIVAARTQAGFEDPLEIMTLPEPQSIFEQMFGGAGVSTPSLQLEGMEDLTRIAGEVRLLQMLFQEPGVLMMPAKVTIQ